VAVKVAVATAVPDNGMERLGFEASEVTVTLPLKLPADAGANFTENVVLCPGDSVTGEKPEMLKPVPVTVAAETEAFTPPVLVRVSV